jgi:hypothetical protein
MLQENPPPSLKSHIRDWASLELSRYGNFLEIYRANAM